MAIRERTEADRTLTYARQLQQGKAEAERLEGVLERAQEPLLFIGLGGTGCGVVARLKRRWELIPEDRRANRVQFFCVDTASFEDNNQDPVVREHIDPVTEYEALCRPGDDLAEWYDELREGSADKFAESLGWYDGRQRPVGEQLGTAGAGAYRQFGRLAFAYGIGRVKRKLSSSAQKVMSAARGGELDALRKPSIWVVSGMSGGTGSGIFLDVIRAVHDALDGYDPRVSAVLVMPDVYRESTQVNRSAQKRMRPNAYALLKELDWIIAMDRTADEYRKSGLELPDFPTNTTPNLPEFVMPIYLLDKDLPKANIAVRNIDDVKELAADGLFALTIGMSERERRSNIDGWITEETSGHRRCIYASYGVSRALVPIFSMVHHLGLSLFARAAGQGLLDRVSDPSSVANAAASAVDELTERLDGVCAHAFDEREDGPSIPNLSLEDVKSKGGTKAVSDFEARLDRLVASHEADLNKDAAQVVADAVATAERAIEEFIGARGDDLATTIAILEGTQRAMKERLSDLSPATDGPKGTGPAAQARLTKHQSGILGPVLQLIGFDQSERTSSLADDAARQARNEALERISACVGREREEFYALVADHTATASLSGGNGLSLFETRLDAAERARTRLNDARRTAVLETDRFRIRRQVDGEVSVATWLFPAALRATGRDHRRADRYMGSLLEKMDVGQLNVLKRLTDDALRRAKTNSPGFALHLVAERSADGRHIDHLDVLRGAFMQVAEEQLKQIAPYLADGVLATAEHDGVTLEEICDRLDTYGQPPLRLTSTATRTYDGGEEAHVLVTWLGPAGSRDDFLDLGHAESGWSEGPTNHEVTRVLTQYGLAVEDIRGMPEFRKEYLQFVSAYCAKTAQTVRTVHVAVGLSDLINDPLAAAVDPERLEDAYERFALGLLLQKLFKANAENKAIVAALRGLVETPPTFMPNEMLPFPISKDSNGRYRLADYQLTQSAQGERVRLASTAYVELGSTVKDAIETLVDGADGRAPAIEVLAWQVLWPGGPFAQKPDDTIKILTTFLDVLRNEMAKTDDVAEQEAFGRLCQEIQEEIDRCKDEAGDGVFRVGA